MARERQGRHRERSRPDVRWHATALAQDLARHRPRRGAGRAHCSRQLAGAEPGGTSTRVGASLGGYQLDSTLNGGCPPAQCLTSARSPRWQLQPGNRRRTCKAARRRRDRETRASRPKRPCVLDLGDVRESPQRRPRGLTAAPIDASLDGLGLRCRLRAHPPQSQGGGASSGKRCHRRYRAAHASSGRCRRSIGIFRSSIVIALKPAAGTSAMKSMAAPLAQLPPASTLWTRSYPLALLSDPRRRSTAASGRLSGSAKPTLRCRSVLGLAPVDHNLRLALEV